MGAAPFNFGGLPKEFSGYAASKIVILPIPFDKTSTWVKGADRGPKAIIDASRHLELYDIGTGTEVYRRGIHTSRPVRAATPAVMVRKASEAAKRCLDDGKFVVTLGGEHSVSLGPITAHAGHFRDLSILHLDAHSDMRDSFEGSRYNHACIMARAKEVTDRIVSVGIRSMDTSELRNIDRRRVFFAEDIHGTRGWINKASGMLSRNVYVTIDLDVFDPAFMPSTGTPEPGGMDWHQVTGLLREVSDKRRIVGFDVVELCPTVNKAPDFLAAKLIYRLLSHIFTK